MADRIAKYVLEIGGDAADLQNVFAGIKSRVRSDVAELKQLTDKVDLFGGIQDSLPQVQRALDSAKARAKAFADEIDRIKAAGGKPAKELTDGLAAAEKAAAQATKELARQQQQLATLDAQLIKAGVNTKSLATEQLRLAEASKVATEAAAQTAAKQALGLVTLKDIAPEVARLRAQFDLLKNSGTLSATETAAAQRQLDARIKELNASVTTTGGSFKSLQNDVKGTFTPLLLQVTAIVAAIGAVGAALNSVTEAAKAYNNSIAKVGTVTQLTADQLGALGKEARTLAQDLGIALPDAVKGLYEIIRSGVPADNAIEVLRLSALAAKAAFVETGVGVQAAGVLIDSFGVDVRNLSGALDIVVRSAQTGGPTLAEFASNAGALGNAARATGADFTEVAAILNVMTDASNDAAGSASVLTKILIQLNRPETRLALHELGVDGRSVADIFKQLDARGLKINEFLDLGIANTKAAAGVAALINNAEKLPAAMQTAATAAGALAEANAKIYDTPEERKKRFDAAIEETKVRLGESVGASSGFAVALTAVLNAINAVDDVSKKYNEHIDEQNKKIFDAIKGFFGFKSGAEEAAPAVTALGGAIAAIQPTLVDAGVALKNAFDALQVNGASIAKQTEAMRKAFAEQITAIKERAAAEIELLDKSTAQQVATAARTLEIQAKQNADILALIKEGESQVNAAVKAAIDARTELGKKTNEGEKETAKAVSKLRLEALSADLTNYKAFQSDLIAQTRARVAAINAIEASRVDFNRGITDAIRAITREGESGLQQYAEKQRDVERLIGEGRQVAATQGIAAAERYFKEAQTISESLKGEVISDGTVVVSAFQGQQAAIAALKKVRDAYNAASQEARDKERVGLDEAKEKLVTVGAAIAKLQTATTELRKQLQDGITIQINKDIVGIAEARAQIADLVKPETKVITVVTQAPGGQSGPVDLGQNFNRGGPVWKRYAAQQFANGGPVFNRPSWSKVPGIGNADTVPALLKEGSFVVRKAASQKYGDGVMAKLAQGFAGGGSVVNNENASAVFEYAKYIRTFLRHPLFEQSRATMDRYIIAILKSGLGNTSALESLLESAVFAANNFQLQDFYGKTASAGGTFLTKPLPDFEEWLRTRPKAKRFAAGGGVGTDTVPAMLTPGEWVIPAPVASKLGGSFLHALNNMQIPMPTIPRFATGGPVGSVPDRGTSTVGGITINIHGAPADFANESAIRRMLIPAMRNIQRRT